MHVAKKDLVVVDRSVVRLLLLQLRELLQDQLALAASLHASEVQDSDQVLLAAGWRRGEHPHRLIKQLHLVGFIPGGMGVSAGVLQESWSSSPDRRV